MSKRNLLLISAMGVDVFGLIRSMNTELAISGIEDPEVLIQSLRPEIDYQNSYSNTVCTWQLVPLAKMSILTGWEPTAVHHVKGSNVKFESMFEIKRPIIVYDDRSPLTNLREVVHTALNSRPAYEIVHLTNSIVPTTPTRLSEEILHKIGRNNQQAHFSSIDKLDRVPTRKLPSSDVKVYMDDVARTHSILWEVDDVYRSRYPFVKVHHILMPKDKMDKAELAAALLKYAKGETDTIMVKGGDFNG